MYIYKSRYLAKKDARADQKTVKVCSGYVNMDYSVYRVWRAQK